MKKKKPHYFSGKDKRIFPTNKERLQALQDAGYDCELVKSEVVVRSDIKAGLLIARKEVIDIMTKYW